MVTSTMWTPPQPGPAGSPVTLHDAKSTLPSPSLLNINNMSSSSLTEALLLLSGMYISLVQPDPRPIQVGLHAIFPMTTASFRLAITEPFIGRNRHVTLSRYRLVPMLFDISTSYSRSEYAPKELLDVMCETIFPHNTITIFYLNNHLGLQRYSPSTVRYLPQMLESLGLPIISYDTQFSPNSRPALSLQLAPTMAQMMDVLFAFLKMFSWSDFSFLCTLSYGCLDEVASIRVKVDEFRRKQNVSVYGVETFSYRLLSYVNFTDGRDKAEVMEKLQYELHKDSRINLVHGNGAEVKTVMDVARQLGLTGQEYVWIFTSASITISEENPTVDDSYPLGSFIIGFDSSRDDMEAVVKMGVNLWLEALNSLAASPDFDSVDFKTRFSCSRLKEGSRQATAGNTTWSPLFWKYGDILYKYMLNTSLPGGMLFDEFGVLKSNRFWIKNVQGQSSSYYSSHDYNRRGNRLHHAAGASRHTAGASRHAASASHHAGAHHSRHASMLDQSSGAEIHSLKRSQGGHHSGIISQKKNLFLPGPDNNYHRLTDKMSGFREDYRLTDKMSGFTDKNSGISRQTGPVLSHKQNPRISRSAESVSTSQRNISVPIDVHSNTAFPFPKNPVGKMRHVLRTRRWRLHYFKAAHVSVNMMGNTDISAIDSSLLAHLSGNDFQKTRPADSLSHRHRDITKQHLLLAHQLPAKSSSRFHSSRTLSQDNTVALKHPGPGDTDTEDTNRHVGQLAVGDERSPPGCEQSCQRPRRAVRKQFAKKIAEWNGHNLSMTGVVWPAGKSTPPKGKPQKYVLRVVTWREEPHVIYSERINSTSDAWNTCSTNSLPCRVFLRDKHLRRLNGTRDVCCTGLCIDLLMRLSELLHFQVELSEVTEGGYGRPLNKNLTDWNGMLGMLIHNEADMAIGALSITPERAAAVDFSVPFLQTGISIIVAIREGVISPTAFLEPYDYPSWGLILVFSVHATGASIFIFEWLSPYGLNQGKASFSVHKFSLFRSFWLIWSMLFGASVTTDQPRGIASRFLANIWALFAVVFCASYTANLAAFMITKDDFYDLSGIQDWRLKNPHHRHPPFKFATIANSSTDVNMENNYKEIHRYMKSEAQTDVKEAIQNLKKGHIQAFIYDSTTLEYEVGKDDFCKLKTVGKRIAETGYGVAFSRKSQWLQEVNRALLHLQENGEIERLQKFWLAGACHKKKEAGVSSHTLGILNFTSAFILLGAGVLLAGVLLILEHIYFRFGRKSLKTCDKHGCCSLVSLSMGQSLTFEQSVMEAIDYHRHYKCKDPLCETQLWKVRYDLDTALLKISQLRRQIAHSAIVKAASRRDSVSSTRKDLEAKLYQNGTTWKQRPPANGSNPPPSSQSVRRPLLALELQTNSNDDDGGDVLQLPSGHTLGQLPERAPFPATQNRSGVRENSIALHDICRPSSTQQSPSGATHVRLGLYTTERQTTDPAHTTASDDDYRPLVGYSSACVHEMLSEQDFTADEITTIPSTISPQRRPACLSLTARTPLLSHARGAVLCPYASMTSRVSSQSLSSVLSSEELQKPSSGTIFRENPPTASGQSAVVQLSSTSLMSESLADDSDLPAVECSHNHYNNIHPIVCSDTRHPRASKLNNWTPDTNIERDSLRETTGQCINIYVNIDEIIGKETSF